MPQSKSEFISEFDRVLKATHGEVRAYLASLGVPLDGMDDLAQEVYPAWFRAPEQRPAGGGAGPLLIGRRVKGGPQPFDGQPDDLRLYDRALTGAEISALSEAK